MQTYSNEQQYVTINLIFYMALMHTVIKNVQCSHPEHIWYDS